MSSQIKSDAPSGQSIMSVSYTPRPRDSRCRYWCKVIEPTTPLPPPGDVKGANDVPGDYLRTGDEIELFEGDAVLEGEAVHRGWVYNVGVVVDGKIVWNPAEPKAVKAWLREQGDREGLRGAGDVAAMIRFLRARRAGFAPAVPKPEQDACEHAHSITTADGNGSYCADCGETLA